MRACWQWRGSEVSNGWVKTSGSCSQVETNDAQSSGVCCMFQVPVYRARYYCVEVSGSYLGRATGYPDIRFFVGLLRPCRQMPRQVQTMIAYFQTTPKLSVVVHTSLSPLWVSNGDILAISMQVHSFNAEVRIKQAVCICLLFCVVTRTLRSWLHHDGWNVMFFFLPFFLLRKLPFSSSGLTVLQLLPHGSLWYFGFLMQNLQYHLMLGYLQVRNVRGLKNKRVSVQTQYMSCELALWQ